MLKENQKSKLLKLLASYSNYSDLLKFSDNLIKQGRERMMIDKKKARGFERDAYNQRAKIHKLQKMIGERTENKRVGITILNNGIFTRAEAKAIYHKFNNPRCKVSKTVSGLMRTLKSYINHTEFPLSLNKFTNVITLLYSYQSSLLHGFHRYYMKKGDLQSNGILFGLGGSKLKRVKYNNKLIDLYNKTYHSDLSHFGTNHKRLAGLSAFESKVINAMHDYYVDNMNSYQTCKNNHLQQQTLVNKINDQHMIGLYNRTYKHEPNVHLKETAQHYHARIRKSKKDN